MREDDRPEAQEDLIWQVHEGIPGAQERLDAFNSEVEEEWADIEQRLDGVDLAFPFVIVCPSPPTLHERLAQGSVIRVDCSTGETVKVSEQQRPWL